eukprot:1162037-Pelagomonas_calceolata.AAC.2
MRGLDHGYVAIGTNRFCTFTCLRTHDSNTGICNAASNAFGFSTGGRKGKGYIAVPACGGSLAEAKRACNHTSPIQKQF